MSEDDVSLVAIKPADAPAFMPPLSGSLKPATLRAYAKAMQHYREAFGGALPCDRDCLDRYVASMRKSAPATVYLRLQALRHEHLRLGHPSPTDSTEVRVLLRQLQRGVFPGRVDKSGRLRPGPKPRSVRKAKPITRALLTKLVDAMGHNALDRRDRCVLLLGFSAALSPSQLIALNIEDVRFTNDAMLLTIRERLDKNGDPRTLAVPVTGHELCAARATSEWIERAELDQVGGPLIRRFDRAGVPTTDRLQAQYIGVVIKRRLTAVGVDPEGYSSLSLKRGRQAEVARGLL